MDEEMLWVMNSILKELKAMNEKLDRLESLEENVFSIKCAMDDTRLDINNLREETEGFKDCIDDIKYNVLIINNNAVDMVTNLQDMSNDIFKIQFDVESIKDVTLQNMSNDIFKIQLDVESIKDVTKIRFK